MKYMSVKEASQKWGISERRVRALCENGRIEGVTRCGDWVWSIPKNSVRPTDGRTLRFIKNMSLRTGSQDYKVVDGLKKSANKNLKENTVVAIIETILAFEGKDISKEQIEKVFKLENQDFPLKDQVEILNLRSALLNLGFEFSEEALCDLNKRLLMGINERNGGQYKMSDNQAQMAEALVSQYAGPWSILHPIARTGFLFTEMMRLNLFKYANEQTAFVVLANELSKAGFPQAIFGKENIPALKAALISSQMRGNASSLVSMITEAVSK